MKNIFLIILAVTTLIGCEKKDELVKLPTLNEYITSNSDVSIFNAVIEKGGLQSFKNGGGPITWFMPSNEALTNAGVTLDSISRMTSGTASFLVTYHMINAKVLSTDMIAQNSIPRNTQQGTQVFLGGSNGLFYVNGSKIITADKELSNGVVHVINRVNIPINLIGNIQAILNKTGQHSLFIAALTRANRWSLFSGNAPFTVVAPTDVAMTNAGLTSAIIASSPVNRVDSIVRFHYFNSIRLFGNDFGNKVTPSTALGGGRTLQASDNGTKLRGRNNATPVNIIRNDILGTNGVVHIIDGVLRY